MRNFSTMLWLSMNVGMILAQDLPIEWEVKLGQSASKHKHHSIDDSLYIASGSSQIAAYRTSDGTLQWSYKFKDKFGVNSFEWQEWNRENGVILLGNSKDPSDKIFIDEKTGDELWRTDKASEIRKYKLNESFNYCFVDSLSAFPIISGSALQLVNVRDGKVIWENREVLTDNEKELSLSFDGRKLMVRHRSGSDRPQVDYIDALTGKKVDGILMEKPSTKAYRFRVLNTPVSVDGKNARIEVRYPDQDNSTGGDNRDMSIRAVGADDHQIFWSTDYRSTIVGALIGTEDFIDFKTQDDVVLVLTKDVTAFDISTGQKLWQQSMPSSDKRSWPKKALYWDLSSMYTESGVVYLAEIETPSVAKLDLRSGKEIWRHKFKATLNKTFSDLLLYADLLIVPSGGRFPYQSEVKSSIPLAGLPIAGVAGLVLSAGLSIDRTSVAKKREFQGDDNAIHAFDRNSGEMKWSVAFDRLTNVVLYDDKLFIGDKKKVVCIEPESGRELFSADFQKSEIGNIYEIAIDSLNRRILVWGNDGIAAIDSKDGQIIYATNTSDNYACMKQGGRWFVVTNADDEMNIKEIAPFDVTSGTLGTKKKVKTPSPDLTDFISLDGQFMFEYELSKIRKYRIP